MREDSHDECKLIQMLIVKYRVSYPAAMGRKSFRSRLASSLLSKLPGKSKFARRHEEIIVDNDDTCPAVDDSEDSTAEHVDRYENEDSEYLEEVDIGESEICAFENAWSNYSNDTEGDIEVISPVLQCFDRLIIVQILGAG